MAYPTKTFEPKVTKGGTQLPLMNLQGKPYLQVAHRLVWFREENPNGIINTEFAKIDEKEAIAKASILLYDERTKQYQLVATGFKKETWENFNDFIEKAETGAVGRALAMAGYGTQFEPALEEGERLADAPVTPGVKNGKKQSKAGTGDSNRTDAAQPAAVQGNATGDTQPAAPQPSSVVGAQPTGVSALPKTSSRQEVNALLSAISKSVIAKRLMTKGEIEQTMQARYGVSKKEELSDAQAQEFMQSLHNVNNNLPSLAPTAASQ